MAVMFVNSMVQVPGTDTTTDLYVCPAGKQAVAQAVRAHNPGTGASDVTLRLEAGGAQMVLGRAAMAAEGTAGLLPDKALLAAGDKLRADSVAEAVDCVVFVMEQDAP